MQDDFTECLVLNTRMAARAVTRLADRRLRPLGITAAQFTIITALHGAPNRSVTDVANSIAMDRSTLSRNLDLLERKGVVRTQGAEKGNGRLCALTGDGETLLEQILPVWREGQAEFKRLLSDPDFPTALNALRGLAKL
ncbi:MAG: MarR family transcriptional regulator [Candidatus Devosia phytovorans]|uniref:MarR family transcriptional regulator n=1 Tax=Candidatus Devosia phytovorans TaxID=3121372 RepID=A0AAJ6B1P3_9HYPH|nr:MarR family transcriptional regulator [Devosia sp.]WEK05574.1 MAG: MarR family transcriptional regulator [Devosia sp.]